MNFFYFRLSRNIYITQWVLSRFHDILVSENRSLSDPDQKLIIPDPTESGSTTLLVWVLSRYWTRGPSCRAGSTRRSSSCPSRGGFASHGSCRRRNRWACSAPFWSKVQWVDRYRRHLLVNYLGIKIYILASTLCILLYGRVCAKFLHTSTYLQNLYSQF